MNKYLKEQGKVWIPFQEAQDKIKEIMQTDKNQTSNNRVPNQKNLTIPNSDSNVHTTIEEPKPQRKNTRKIQRIKPTKVTWTENQIYEYMPEDTINSRQSIVRHFSVDV